MHLGDVLAGSTLYVYFNTVDATGAPITLAGTPAARAYKNASTTETSTGVTLTVDFDARTGMHVVAIDTSADGTFYAAGTEIAVVITVGTVSGVSIAGQVVGMFSIENRSAFKALTSTTYAEPASVPAATATLKDKIGWLCALARNKITQTSTTQTLRNDGDSGTIGTSTISDVAGTTTRGKYT